MCNCYVRHLVAEVRFALRPGAHNPLCLAYQLSDDPVDRGRDQLFRLAAERPPVQVHRIQRKEVTPIR
jgi:hypothetical protein